MSTVAEPKHAHKWKSTAHLDGCHFYTTIYACTKACGATATKTYERNPLNPMTAIWMEEQYQEVRRDARGRFVKPHWEPIYCQRCDELKHGSPIRVDLVIVNGKGEIEREDHTEHEQKPEEDEDD